MARVLPYTIPEFLYTLVIANGQTVSSAIDIKNTTLVGMFVPTFTGTTITFQASQALGGSYVNMVDGAGNVISKTVASTQYLYLDPNIFAGVRFLQVTSGSAEGGTRTLTLSTRSIT